MKLFTTMICLLFLTIATAQDFTKDTIQLKNLDLTENKFKIKSKSLGSLCTSFEPFKQTQGVVTLIDELPLGYLHSITFNFNNPYDKNQVDFQDAEIEMLFFEVTASNTPGNRITSDKKTVLIKKEFSGKMEINIRDLNIESNGKMFIGLRNLTRNKGGVMQFEVDCVCMPKKSKKISFERYDDISPWNNTLYTLEAIKMKVKVEVL